MSFSVVKFYLLAYMNIFYLIIALNQIVPSFFNDV